MSFKRDKKTIEYLSGKIESVNSVLDVGSGIPELLFRLQLKNDNISSLTAIDYKPCLNENGPLRNVAEPSIDLLDLIEKLDDDELDYEFHNSHHKCYLYYKSLAHHLNKDFIKDTESFKRTFSFQFNHPLADFFSHASNKRYDLIILSKVLSHMDEDPISVIERLKDKHLKESGIMFIRLNSESFIGREFKRTFNYEDALFICDVINKNSTRRPIIEKIENQKHYVILGED